MGMTKLALKSKAIALRKKGYSYNLIREKVPVSKSTLSLWLADIPFTPNEKVRNRVKRASSRVVQWSQKRKRESEDRARKEAQHDVGKIDARDLFMLGIGLYIGEGSKTGGNVRIINADPQVISLAIRWFEDIFGLNTKHFSITMHLYPDNDIEQSLAFWSRAAGIPKHQFGKTQIDTRIKKAKKRGMLRHGTAHLVVKAKGEKRFGVFLFRKIKALIRETYKHID